MPVLLGQNGVGPVRHVGVSVCVREEREGERNTTLADAADDFRRIEAVRALNGRLCVLRDGSAAGGCGESMKDTCRAEEASWGSREERPPVETRGVVPNSTELRRCGWTHKESEERESNHSETQVVQKRERERERM